MGDFCLRTQHIGVASLYLPSTDGTRGNTVPYSLLMFSVFFSVFICPSTSGTGFWASWHTTLLLFPPFQFGLVAAAAALAAGPSKPRRPASTTASKAFKSDGLGALSLGSGGLGSWITLGLGGLGGCFSGAPQTIRLLSLRLLMATRFMAEKGGALQWGKTQTNFINKPACCLGESFTAFNSGFNAPLEAKCRFLPEY